MYGAHSYASAAYATTAASGSAAVIRSIGTFIAMNALNALLVLVKPALNLRPQIFNSLAGSQVVALAFLNSVPYSAANSINAVTSTPNTLNTVHVVQNGLNQLTIINP